MVPNLPHDASWSEFLDALAEAEGEGPARREILLKVPAEGSQPAADVLLHALTSVERPELRFRRPVEVRKAAAQCLLAWGPLRGLVELCAYQREHWFLEGETEEISELVDELIQQRFRPFLGLSEEELVPAVEESLRGERSPPETVLSARDMNRIRLVVFAMKDLVPLLPVRGDETLGWLALEAQGLEG